MTFLDLVKSISKKEWQLVGLVFLVLTFLTTFSLIYGWLVAPENHTLTNIHFAIPGDVSVYYSFIMQVKQGDYLFANYFGGPEQGRLFNILWLAVGFLARIFDLSALVAFNLARILAMPFLLITLYLLGAYFFAEVKKRQAAFLLLIFSSGFGTFFLDRMVRFPGNYDNGHMNWPMDLWVPELTVFNTIFYSPHFIVSLGFLLLVFLFTFIYGENFKTRYSIYAGLCSLILISFHPFHALTIFIVVGVYFLILSFRAPKDIFYLIKHYAIVALFTFPAAWYYLNLISTDWVMAVREVQNTNPTTPFWITVISFGIFVPAAIAGAYILIKNKKISNKNLGLIVWAAVHFGVIYLPVIYQRRMVEGLQIPLVLLSVVAFSHFLSLPKIKKQATIIIILSLFILPASNVFTLATDVYIFANQRFLAYLDKDLVMGMEWLAKNISKDSLILSEEVVSNLIPGYTARGVYVGHGVETPFYRSRVNEVEWFFANNKDSSTEKRFLSLRSIDYIFYNESTRDLGGYDPDLKDYLTPVFVNQAVTIYQVNERID